MQILLFSISLILLGRNKKKKHEKERLERQAECGVFHEPDLATKWIMTKNRSLSIKTNKTSEFH